MRIDRWEDFRWYIRKSEIIILGKAPLTGPKAEAGRKVRQLFTDNMRRVNEEDLIPGKKVKLFMYDEGADLKKVGSIFEEDSLDIWSMDGAVFTDLLGHMLSGDLKQRRDILLK